LWVLPAGGTQRAQASVNSQRLARLLDELREHADFVVLDTPPALLTAEMADLAHTDRRGADRRAQRTGHPPQPALADAAGSAVGHERPTVP
jgi:hypothetical protein